MHWMELPFRSKKTGKSWLSGACRSTAIPRPERLISTLGEDMDHDMLDENKGTKHTRERTTTTFILEMVSVVCGEITVYPST
jgi:hypothetical protein